MAEKVSNESRGETLDLKSSNFNAQAMSTQVERFLIKYTGNKNVFELCKGKHLVLFIGMTGSGKSTTYNYSCGVPMKECTGKELGLSTGFLTKKYIHINETNVASQISPSPIGHGGESKTDMPIVCTVNDLVFCDCPGFFDNRGLEFLLTNTVTMKEILNSVSSCRIIVTVPYAHIEDSRSPSLNHFANLFQNMFCSEELLKRHSKSVCFCVTKLPRKEEESFSIDQLREILKNIKSETIQLIAENKILIYDPLDRNDRLFGPVLSRQQLLNEIETIPSVENTSEVFGTGLSAEEEVKISNYIEDICHMIDQDIDKNLLAAAFHFQIFYRLNILEHKVVEQGVSRLRKKAEEALEKRKEEFEKRVDKLSIKEAQDAKELFQKVSSSFSVPGHEEFVQNLWEKANQTLLTADNIMGFLGGIGALALFLAVLGG